MSGHPSLESDACTLECAGCGSPLTSQSEPLNFNSDQYCILQCNCSEYPVIAGIPLVFHDRVFERDLTVRRLIELVKAGKNDRALMEALTPATVALHDKQRYFDFLVPFTGSESLRRRRRNKALRAWREELLRLSNVHEASSTIKLFQHYFKHHPAGQPASDYFSYRFGQPKYLTTISLAGTMPLAEGAAIDLGCGAGHFTRNLLLQNGGAPVYGVDIDFFLLWVANTRIAPNARFICTDLEHGIPLASDSAASMLMSNFFQFIHGKQQLAREAERVVQKATGVIALSTVRHSGYKAKTPNRAISVTDYQSLFQRRSVALVDENILERYTRGFGPDVRETADAMELESSPLVSLVVSDNPSVFHQYGAVDLPPHCLGMPRINALYKRKSSSPPGSDVSSYRIAWPSDQYTEDNYGIVELLPQEVSLCQGSELESASSLIALADYPDDY